MKFSLNFLVKNINTLVTQILTFILTCSIESLSRMVTVWGFLLTVSKSIVTPKGMQISSVLEYLFPILPDDSSILTDKFKSVKASAGKKSDYEYLLDNKDSSITFYFLTN